jgi:hypothetical protein
MRSATESAPRFQTGDWVAAHSGFRKIIGQIIEDRGPIGLQGRRLYQLQVGWGDGETTIEMPEVDLHPAPPIEPADVASDRGYSTQNWPRQRFHMRYLKDKGSNAWTAQLWRIRNDAVPPMLPPREDPGRANSEFVAVSLEYDPRADDPREFPEIWECLTEKAMRTADIVFKARHPRARVTYQAAPHT